MTDLAHWTRKLQDAERELDAATRRTEVNAAAQRLMRVKAELKALERAPARWRLDVASPPTSEI